MEINGRLVKLYIVCNCVYTCSFKNIALLTIIVVPFHQFDTSGIDRFQSIRIMYSRDCSGVMIVVDVTNMVKSFTC